jgi:hypothetical protein
VAAISAEEVARKAYYNTCSLLVYINNIIAQILIYLFIITQVGANVAAISAEEVARKANARTSAEEQV